jgi:magnesium chelatase subunit I
VLVGSGNPEEGELRPQLLDRFGLAVDVTTPTDIKLRIEVIKRRDTFERDPESFVEQWRKEDEKIRRRIVAGRKRLDEVKVPDPVLERAAHLCMALGTDGLRGEYEGDTVVNDTHLKRMAAPALRHRLRRNPLDDAGSGTRVARAVDELFASNG